MSNSQIVEFSPNVENCVILMHWRLISLFLFFISFLEENQMKICWVKIMCFCRGWDNTPPPHEPPLNLILYSVYVRFIANLDNVVFLWCLQTGSVASSCNPASGKSGYRNDMRLGVLIASDSCWTGVRTKVGMNMASSGEPEGIRLSKERRSGPEGQPSSQEPPCRSVVGPRRWVVGCNQPCQQSQTNAFFHSILFFWGLKG